MTWALLGVWLLDMLRRYWGYLLLAVLGFYAYHRVQLFFSPVQPKNPVWRSTYRVVAVVGPASIEVRGGLLGYRNRTLTLWGLDVPEAVRQAAAEFLTQQVAPDDRIEAEWVQGDAALVYVGNGSCLNLALVRAGLATSVSDRRDFLAAQTEAQRRKAGVWKTSPKPKLPFWKDNPRGPADADPPGSLGDPPGAGDPAQDAPQ